MKNKGAQNTPSINLEGLRDVVIFGLAQMSEKDHEDLGVPLSKAIAENLRGIPGARNFLLESAESKQVDREALDNAVSCYMLQELHKSGLPLDDLEQTISEWISG